MFGVLLSKKCVPFSFFWSYAEESIRVVDGSNYYSSNNTVTNHPSTKSLRAIKSSGRGFIYVCIMNVPHKVESITGRRPSQFHRPDVDVSMNNRVS